MARPRNSQALRDALAHTARNATLSFLCSMSDHCPRRGAADRERSWRGAGEHDQLAAAHLMQHALLDQEVHKTENPEASIPNHALRKP
eukprot:513223-Karenia_brevis.AAC.1